MKRVLVTGATGNVGRQVVADLLATDCQIRALTRHPDGAGLPRQVEVMRDLTDADGFGFRPRCAVLANDALQLTSDLWIARAAAAHLIGLVCS